MGERPADDGCIRRTRCLAVWHPITGWSLADRSNPGTRWVSPADELPASAGLDPCHTQTERVDRQRTMGRSA